MPPLTHTDRSPCAEGAVCLVVGLGNPGADYEPTRHNAGFMAADALITELSGGRSAYTRMRCDALVSELGFEGRTVAVARPQTYMNLSGRSVKGLLKQYGLALDGLLVIQDDLDLPVATLRLKQGGGDGGHRGVRSVIDSVGAGFARLKIGVGRPPGQMPAERYALLAMRGEELEGLRADAARAADIACAVLRHGVLRAQNEYNGI
ncbi:MAG: aminoacyl-tRNA hydrolase [Coriobacteriales bacterium]|jgi:PTH1 family peptidyl-tRNA hydrolase|nr:aminoacyl-tRNA hydrolase [Coriobacteriales bacterium]